MFEVLKVNKNTLLLDIHEKKIKVEKDECSIDCDSWLPAWGTMWTLNTFDSQWVEENLETVARCGFRIFESEELGIFIGIDGAGYDFFDEHWIPLYKARGLKWHDTKED